MSLPRVILAVAALLLILLQPVSSIDACKGEGPRYGDYKCNHDPTHRVCASLKDDNGNKIDWGGSNFWQLTHQYDWSNHVGSDPKNPGGGWCICMWATASLIRKVGCDNVHMDCGATDVTYVMRSYTDGGVDLEPAKQCLLQKCPQTAPQPVPPPPPPAPVEQHSGTECSANATGASVTAWSGSSVRDLHSEYYSIFKTGNRNAASHLWSTFLFDRAPQMTHQTFLGLAAGYCAVSGSPVQPSRAKRYKITLPALGGGDVTGYMYYCCSPCACDTLDWIKVDTACIRTADGTRQHYVAVMGNPCVYPQALNAPYANPFSGGSSTLARDAPELACDGQTLRGATLSDNGHVILSIFFMEEGAAGVGASTASISGAYNDVSAMAQQCQSRADQGYASGMGLIFQQIAKINPINISASSSPETAEKTTSQGTSPVVVATVQQTLTVDATAWTSDLKQVMETAYGIALGLYDSQAATYLPGASVTSSVASSRRAINVDFRATGSNLGSSKKAYMAAAATQMASGDMSALSAAVKSANSALQKNVMSPDITGASTPTTEGLDAEMSSLSPAGEGNEQKDSGLATGALVGIVVSCLVGVAALAVGVFYFFHGFRARGNAYGGPKVESALRGELKLQGGDDEGVDVVDFTTLEENAEAHGISKAGISQKYIP